MKHTPENMKKQLLRRREELYDYLHHFTDKEQNVIRSVFALGDVKYRGFTLSKGVKISCSEAAKENKLKQSDVDKIIERLYNMLPSERGNLPNT